MIRKFPKPKVIDQLHPYSHTVIEASAGTGKTYALEHIVLDMLITNRCRIDEILVLTYTERATQELKTRIRELIERACGREETALEDDTSFWAIDQATEAHLLEQLDQFARASIHTIHGFCHRVLTENAFQLNRPLTETQDSSANIFDRAFKRALREKFSTTLPFKGYLRQWLQGKSLFQLQRDLEQVCRYDDALFPAFNEGLLVKTVEELQAYDDPMSYFQEDFRDAWVLNFVAQVVAVARVSDSSDLPQFLKNVDSILGIFRGARKNRGDAVTADFAHGRYETEQSKTVARLMLNLVPLNVATLQLFRDAMPPYIQAEKRKGFFDFDDMLTGVHERLIEDVQGSETLRAFLRSRYRFALVDEFQDTDAKQWDICRQIFVDSPDGGNPLIIIGDPKQSIYGWRGADVHTYLRAKEYVVSKSNREIVPLMVNYRSTARMIEGYNAIFDAEDRSPFFTGEIVYDNPVECGIPDRTANRRGEECVPIELLSPTPTEGALDAYALKRVLGRKIASEIRDLLEDPIVISDESGEREVGPSDIYVLTHTHEEARFIGRFLKRFGVHHSFFKQEGLFQTEEAQQIMDLLQAIATPYSAPARIKAWATPFFCAPWRDLQSYVDIPETDPFFARLLSWNQLATKRDFEALFAFLIDDTGVARREIFDGEGHRKLTNYTHILEILLDEARKDRLDIDQVTLRLHGFIKKSKLTERDERNIQRLDTHQDAVQLMTIHTSKGLEADVVFLFGGFSNGRRGHGVRFVHGTTKGGERALYYGPPQSEPAKKLLNQQSRGETERVLYVALTRARVKMYLPFIPNNEKGKPVYSRLDGHHACLNARLIRMQRSGVLKRERCFRVSPVYVDEWITEPQPPPVLRVLDAYVPPEPPLPVEIEERPDPLVMTSYSRMKKGSYEVESFQTDSGYESLQKEEDLPSGTTVGIFLHELLEQADFEVMRTQDFQTWSGTPSVKAWCIEKMVEQGIDTKFETRSLQLVWDSVMTPFTESNGTSIPNIAMCSHERREVEFHMPIPQRDHGSKEPNVPFEVDRGFFKGFIDLVFEHDGRIYFADWKSDALESFEDDVVQRHVSRNYAVQADLYTLALAQMFNVTDEASYERIGGYVYVFMRGITGSENRGFYSGRLSWDEVSAYREKLFEKRFSDF